MSEQKFHVAVISTWFPVPADTSGIFVQNQADALIDSGNKVSVFMFQYISPMSWFKKKLRGEPLSMWSRGRKIIPLAYDFVNFLPTRFSSNPAAVQKNAFLRYIEKSFMGYISKNGKPDIIHHHGVADFCYITSFLSKKFDIPYVITEHSMFIDKIDHFNPYESKEERISMIRNAALRIAVSNFYAEFNGKLFGTPFIVIPNMVNNDFAEIQLPTYPKKTTPFYFLNIGSLARRKRQDILVQAFAEAYKGNKNIQLIIIGNGELEKNLSELISVLNMNEQIHLAGYKERAQIIELIDKSHILVISSEKESFSMVAVEALFRGNPVLTTQCKGPEDFINAGNGITCKVNDIKDMKEKLLYIYDKYSSFNYLQIAEEAKKQFSEKIIVAKLEEAYKKVVSSYSRSN
ncbi:MAG: glycosyltransferase [Bacteroidia bacterium]